MEEGNKRNLNNKKDDNIDNNKMNEFYKLYQENEKKISEVDLKLLNKVKNKGKNLLFK
jgi:hypothetical protein